MAVERVERVGDWSVDKLDDLQAYMAAYASIMNVQKTRRGWLNSFFYIDAFAGPGLVAMRDDNALDEEAVTYLNGSPLRALDCEPKFDHLWFIDKQVSRKDTLTALLEERHETSRADIVIGDCNDLLQGIVSGMANNERALAFLDPYGLQLEWATVNKLAETKKVDVFINFSIMGILRNLPRDGRPADSVKGKLNRVLANTDWVDAIYVDKQDFWGGIKSSRTRH